MRVSHRNIYANVVQYTNTSLRELMELNLKASSQKNINRPSDNPVGMTRILGYRDTLKSMEQYRANIDTAQGWLGLADNNLMQVSTVLTRLKELAQQAATGTYTSENRAQIGIEARQLFEHLITLANSNYEGKYIFSGHKTDTPAFRPALFAQSNDESIRDQDILGISGGSGSTILVQFLEGGSTGNDELAFRHSRDGGKTWTEGTLPTSDPDPGDPVVMDLGGVRVTLAAGRDVSATDRNNTNDTNGTWLWVRPSAIYQGDDEDGVNVDQSVREPDVGTAEVVASADGFFRGNVMVRIDSIVAPVDALNPGTVGYSYSIDGGRNWVESNSAPVPYENPASLPVPGGFLTLQDDGDPPEHPPLTTGDQFVIRPNRALKYVEISQNETIQMNNIGKEVFGGLYSDPDRDNTLQPVRFNDSAARNLFEIVGRMVGYLETNTQHGAQKAVDELEKAHQHITTALAGVGARENRLASTRNILLTLQLNTQDRKSRIEDVDIADLMTKLRMQEINYEAVLKSSNMIMRMSLINFI